MYSFNNNRFFDRLNDVTLFGVTSFSYISRRTGSVYSFTEPETRLL